MKLNKSIRFYPFKFARAVGIIAAILFVVWFAIKWQMVAIRHDEVILEQYLEDYSYRFNN